MLGAAMVAWGMARPKREGLALALARGHATEPAEVGLEGQEVVFRLTQDVQSPGWVIPGGDPSGPDAVLLHGFGASRYAGLVRASWAAPYCRQVVVFDQRGSGEATGGWCTFGRREADDAARVAEQLHETAHASTEPTEPHPVVLYGWSMGAQTAVLAGARYPERFAGVFAEAPFHTRDEPIRIRLRKRRLPAWPSIEIGAAIVRLFGGSGPFDRTADARRLRSPLWVVHGERDTVCPPESGRLLAEAAPEARYVGVPDAGHHDLLDVGKQAYQDALASFFARLAGPKSSPAPRHTPLPEASA